MMIEAFMFFRYLLNNLGSFSLITSFDFERACFFCGELCDVKPDRKHPDRWEKNATYLCWTADRGKDQVGKKRMSFKDVILQVSYQLIVCVTIHAFVNEKL